MYPGVTSKKVSVILLGGILLQMISYRVFSQPPSNFVQDDFQHKVILYDVNGRPIGNEAIETKGSPLFVTRWKLGWIRLNDGRFFPGVPLKLDLEKQIVHYKRADGNDIEVEPGVVKDLAMLDTIGGADVVYRFASGFKPIDNQSQTSFYLYLDSGRISLLESVRKVLSQDKNEFSGSVEKEYKLYSDLYVLSAGKMVRIKRDSKFFQELTSDKKGQMDDYLQKDKVSFRSIDDIRQFIHYYNGLP